MGNDHCDPPVCRSTPPGARGVVAVAVGAMPTLAAGMKGARFRLHAHGKRGHSTNAPSLARRGLTLIEVMLVLALLVIIAAFCLPAISRAFVLQRLKKSADVVRTQWCKARVRAMSNDQVVLFRYEMGGTRFVIQQITDVSSFENADGGTQADSSAGTSSIITSNSSANTGGGTSPNISYPTVGGVQTLPDGVTFRACQIENDSRAMTVDATQSSNLETDIAWSAPIYFYPDGTSSDARLQICNDRNGAIELLLRGMTGVVTVGDVVPVAGGTP